MPDSSEPAQSRPRWPPWRRSRRPRSSGESTDWNWKGSLADFLLIGIVAAIVSGLVLGHVQHQSDQKLSRDQQQSDQKLSRDQQRATTLQTYINNMQDLLLNHKLAQSAPGDEIRHVATVQTLSTLRSLDPGRNIILLRFLQDAHLIGIQDPVINLTNANLSNDNLSGADLSNVDLQFATLTDTDLNGAHLNGAILYGANLNNADLTGTDLNDASLIGALLDGSIMNRAILTDARLNDASLTGAQLNGAYLGDANLNGAVLTGTDLRGADVSDASLAASGLTQQQLDTVHSCTDAELSPGPPRLTCEQRPPIQLTYWYTESPAEKPVIRTLIAQFEQQHPDIHINAMDKNFYQTQIGFEKSVDEGKAPDILRSDVGWVSQFASQGYLLNIDSYAPQDDLSDYLPAPLKYDYYNGDLYGLPQVTDFLALLYNKAELKKAHITIPSPPSTITMTEFAKDAQQVMHYKAARYGFETDGTSYTALPFLYAFGGGMLDQHNNPTLVRDAGSVAGLSFLLGLQNNDKAMPANVNFSTAPVPFAVTDFTNGTTAMIFGGPYDVPDILKGTGSVFTGNPSNLGIAEIPTCPAGTSTCHPGQTGTPVGGQSYVISADTMHPIEANKFIKFMSQASSQVEIAEANHTLPTSKSAYNYKQVSSDPFISEFRSILGTGTVVARQPIPEDGLLFDTFDPYIEDALDGAESPIAALDAVAETWKQLLTGS